LKGGNRVPYSCLRKLIKRKRAPRISPAATTTGRTVRSKNEPVMLAVMLLRFTDSTDVNPTAAFCALLVMAMRTRYPMVMATATAIKDTTPTTSAIAGRFLTMRMFIGY